MKKMTIVMMVAVALVAAVFAGCKHFRGQILDGPGMVRDSADYPVKEAVDSMNKEAVHDSLSVEAEADGVSVAPESDWTEEAVANQIRKYFDAVNKTFSEGSSMDPFDLDKKYYTAHWNEVYDAVNEKEGKVSTVEERFFIDDFHWTAGLRTPVEVKDIKVELLTGNMADAQITLFDKTLDITMKQILKLDYERGMWRINNWLEEDNDISGSLLVRMEKYVGL